MAQMQQSIDGLHGECRKTMTNPHAEKSQRKLKVRCSWMRLRELANMIVQLVHDSFPELFKEANGIHPNFHIVRELGKAADFFDDNPAERLQEISTSVAFPNASLGNINVLIRAVIRLW